MVINISLNKFHKCVGLIGSTKDFSIDKTIDNSDDNSCNAKNSVIVG